MTKDELRQYNLIAQEIATLQDEVLRIRDSLSIVQQLSDMPKSKSEQDRIADTVAKIVDMETEIHTKIRLMIELRGRIEESISLLPADFRLLMRLRYIEGRKWERIACDMNYGWKYIHRLHGKALQMLKEDTKRYS